MKALIFGAMLTAIAAHPAVAQIYTTTPRGDGGSTTVGPGGIYTTTPRGDGGSTTVGPGGIYTTLPRGGFSPPYQR
jgi:hypothetical protein